MPYLQFGRKKELDTEPQRANTPGDFNYLFTKAYLKAFIAKPRYETIAQIKRASVFTNSLGEVQKVQDLLCGLGVSNLDLNVARELAFVEFYRRIGSGYETHARVENGDLELFEEAEQAIINKFSKQGVK